MKNVTDITVNPIFTENHSYKGKVFLRMNSKKHMQDSPTKSFEEILKAKMEVIQNDR